MDGTKTTSLVENVRIDDHSNHLMATKPNQTYGHQQQSNSGNDRNQGNTYYIKPSSLSALSSFVTHDGVTFDARRNQGFQDT